MIKIFFSILLTLTALQCHTCCHGTIQLFLVHAHRYILHAKKTAFVVEHDFIMATYLADRVIVFDGIPSKSTSANT